jgi:hypothetical protein
MPRPPMVSLFYFLFFKKIHKVIRNSRYSASVVNTGGKFAIVSLRLAANLPPDIGGYNFTEIYIDREGDIALAANLPPVSTKTAVI